MVRQRCRAPLILWRNDATRGKASLESRRLARLVEALDQGTAESLRRFLNDVRCTHRWVAAPNRHIGPAPFTNYAASRIHTRGGWQLSRPRASIAKASYASERQTHKMPPRASITGIVKRSHLGCREQSSSAD